MRNLRYLALVGLILLSGALARSITAQTTFGAIMGTVRDSAGAVVPNATVEATHVASNYKYTTTSNESGNYTLPQLREGEYILRGSAAGYQEFIAKSILLAARDERRVEVVLQVGSIQSAVEVVAGATLIETDTPRIGDSKDANQLKSLPLNTRQLYNFLALSPGVVPAGGGENFRRFAGSRRNQSDQTIDGISVSTGQDGTQITPLVQYVESFQEVRVDMANNSADTSSVGQVTIVSKSGTNELHGSLFDYYATPWFRARNAFATQRPTGIFHNPGGSIGGPIVIPKIYDGHNKSFFFFSFENRAGSNILQRLDPSVPLEAWRSGDFSQTLDNNGNKVYIRDPSLTGMCRATPTNPTAGVDYQAACFRDPLRTSPDNPTGLNIIPLGRINQVSRMIQNRFYPLPNGGSAVRLTGSNYATELSRALDPNVYWTTRLDHRFSDRASGYARYTWNRSYNRTYEANLPTIGQLDRVRNTRASLLSFTYLINPRLVSESRWGISFSNDPRRGPLNGLDVVNSLGLQGLVDNLPDIGGVPNIRFTNLGLTTITQTAVRRPGAKSFTNQWQEHLNWYHGRHSLKTGFQVGRYQFVDGQQNNNLFGNLTFSGNYTQNSYADFLLGIPRTMARAFPTMETDRRRWGYDFFVTDDFKVSQRLTLNLGFRYEYHPYWSEANGLLSIFDIERGKIIVADGSLNRISPLLPRGYVDVIEAREAGLPGDTLIRTDRNNIAPRIGFAYRPLGNDTVIRGGFGLFYDSVPRSLTAGAVPFIINEPNFTNPTIPVVTLPQVFPAAGVAVNTVTLPQAVNTDLRIPYSMQYNFTVEHQRWHTGFRLSYIGTNTRQGDYTFNINQPVPDARPYGSKPRLFPRYPAITYRTNGAGHQYHSMVVEVERRLVKGLAYQASWTMAKDIEDLNGFLFESPENAYDRLRERGDSLDVPRHRITGSLIYDLPFGNGKRFLGGSNKTVDRAVGGWTYALIFSRQSGQYLTPFWTGADPTGTAFTSNATPATVTIRPDMLRDPNLPASQRTTTRWFDPTAFAAPQPGRFGTSAKGVILGPSTTVFHAGLAKQLKFTERMHMRFELTATNIFNQVNFGNPALNISDSNIGIINDTVDDNLDQAGPRAFRLGLRLEW